MTARLDSWQVARIRSDALGLAAAAITARLSEANRLGSDESHLSGGLDAAHFVVCELWSEAIEAMGETNTAAEVVR